MRGRGWGTEKGISNLKFQISDGGQRQEWRKRGGDLTAGKKRIPRGVDAGCVARDDREKRGGRGANGGKDGDETGTLPMRQDREGCGTRKSKPGGKGGGGPKPAPFPWTTNGKDAAPRLPKKRKASIFLAGARLGT